MRNCVIFISPHGGGMGNIIWSNEKTRVFEIISRDGLKERPCYYHLANTLGLEYNIIEPYHFNFFKKMTVNCKDINVKLT